MGPAAGNSVTTRRRRWGKLSRRRPTTAAEARARLLGRVPGRRGFSGRGGGASLFIEPAPTWRGTSMQVCGLWPFSVGSGSPNVGVPMGPNIKTGERTCVDPISWFRAGLINNPSVFVEAIPGVGKTTMIQRMLIGLEAFGILPMVFGDIRPDYVHLIRAMGGQVIRLGGGTGHLNPLDMGDGPQAVESMRAQYARIIADESHDTRQAHKLAEAITELETDIKARRLLRVITLIKLSRGADPSDRERNIVARTLSLLDEQFTGEQVPVLADLLEVIRAAPPRLRVIALDRGSDKRYQELTEELEATLVGLAEGTRFGDMFSLPTSEPMRMDTPVVFDVSQLRSSPDDVQAAALAVAWSYGVGNIGTAQILADAGLIPRQLYAVVIDELHRVLRAGQGMVEIVDQSTRLNRTDGTGIFMITHTQRDLEALANEEDRKKAMGFIERSGMVILGGLPLAETQSLNQVVPLSRREKRWLEDWSTAPGLNVKTGALQAPPGRGKFLVKVGREPGVPFQLELTPAEKSLQHSGYRWDEATRQELEA